MNRTCLNGRHNFPIWFPSVREDFSAALCIDCGLTFYSIRTADEMNLLDDAYRIIDSAVR